MSHSTVDPSGQVHQDDEFDDVTKSEAEKEPEGAVARRKAAVAAAKREIIRGAAKRIFARNGLTRASVREIAKAAGYTTGAIYFHYPSKEAIYAEILEESLAALQREIRKAVDAASQTNQRTIRALRCFFEFYRDRPSEFDLGFYLYGGTKPVGLGRELDAALNARLRTVFETISESMIEDGLETDSVAAQRRAVLAGSQIFGLVLMTNTGRLKILDQNPDQLLDDYLREFSHRCGP